MSGCGALDEDFVPQQQPATSNNACSNPDGCSKTGCQQTQKQQGSFGSWVRRQDTKDSAPQAAQDLHQLQQQQQDGSFGNCMKCKKHPAVLFIRQQEPYCNECLETGVLQKFRTCTKAQGLIKTHDNVLLALSGGAASISLLYSTMAMKSSNMNRPERGKVPFQLSVVHVDSRAARSVSMEQAQAQVQQLRSAAAAAGFDGQVLVLPLHAVFATQEQLQELLQAAQQQQQQQPGVLQLQHQLDAVHLAAAEAVQPTTSEQQESTSTPTAAAAAHTDGVVSGSSITNSTHASQAQQQQWQQQLCDLLSRVSDTTGREDLATYLQDSLLMRTAAALGCGRLLRGECADRVAANIIAAAAKGRGFSLPGDIQMLDARMLPNDGPAVLRPVREVTYKELVGLCAYKCVPWSDRAMGQPAQWELPAAPGAGRGSSSSSKAVGHAGGSLNSLSERFIADMAGSVPASIYTILRTASHLQPFDFSEVATVPGAVEVQSSAIRQSVHNRQQAVHGTSASVGCRQRWQLCAVCRAPLPARTQKGNTADAAAMDRLVLAGLTGAHSRQLCYSCNRQILYNVQPDAADEILAGAKISVEARMQRLRALLPPGTLLQDDEV